ncbi:MAG: hypothetical protein CMJ76_13890 [Planctomycetaceae bacterium]|nr:hypothetical protein [Planctomycetaceae bacterium]
MTRTRIILLFLFLLQSLVIQAAEPTQGYKSLFIGHSFFVPMARGMTVHAHRAGFKEHQQLVFFEGGDRGTPGYFWENSRHSGNIQKALRSGEIELFGMTWTGVGRGKGTFEHFKLWVDYAITYNPKTTFCLAMPWGRFPARYKIDHFTQEMEKATNDFYRIIDRLRDTYPENEFFCINYGRGALELKKLHHAKKLTAVDGQTKSRDKGTSGIFTDALGHPDKILIELGQLIWLGTIYNVDLGKYDYEHGFDIDLKAIAKKIIEEDNYGRHWDDKK